MSSASLGAGLSVEPDLWAQACANYENNLNRVSVASQQRGDASVLAAMTGSLWLDADHFSVAAGASHRSTVYFQVTDYTSHVPAVWLRGAWLPWSWLSVAVKGQAGWVFQGDPARNGARADLGATIRVRPAQWLAVRGGFGVTHREANDPVFAYDSLQASGSLEVRPAAWLRASGGYSADIGSDVLYEEVPVGASATALEGTRGARWQGERPTRTVRTFPPTSVAAELVAVRVPSVLHSAWAAVEVRLPRGFSAAVFYRLTRGDNLEAPYLAHLVSAELGWALP